MARLGLLFWSSRLHGARGLCDGLEVGHQAEFRRGLREEKERCWPVVQPPSYLQALLEVFEEVIGFAPGDLLRRARREPFYVTTVAHYPELEATPPEGQVRIDAHYDQRHPITTLD